MKEYTVDFEEDDSGYVWASSGEDAIEKAKKVFYYAQSWRCIGLDQVKE